MKEKMQRFMSGRYGFDELSKLLLTVTLALMVISLFTRNSLFYLVSLAMLVYVYYRALSRKLDKRQMENQKFVNLRYQSVVKWKAFRNRQAQKKTHRFYKCPNCRQTVRVPKGRGKICITCPKCRTEFIKKS